ncbi:MAG TPA: alpha/beta fold hydrolase, partial [Propionibacteriaceae bacterium]|nr:alpha/beta fold hydrolase [Propionibacteriaceae bacterium]
MPRPRSAEPDLTGSVGFVSTQKVTLFDSDTPLRLARGGVLAPVEVAYETYGELSRRGDNAVFVCHALTGDAHAAGYHPGARRPGWWDTMIGPGKPLDTTRMFVVCANLIGGCQGTTGPASTNPATGAAYGMDFPLLDMVDFVTVHRALLKHLGVTKLVAAFGGSLGGMQVLEWALRYPEDMATAV